jgi:hypothetical protein
MQSAEHTIRVRTLGHKWETYGTGRARGVWPENVQLAADKWGPSSASFDLKRDPSAIWPDLATACPVEVEVGGVRRWSGRIKETPMRDASDQVINVQCEGWQFHLDDDVYVRTYVHTRLSDYKDMRSFLGADLTLLYAAGTVSNDRGSIVLSMPVGSAVPLNGCVGVMLDLGLKQGGKRAVIEWESSNNSSVVEWIVRASSNEEPIGDGPGNNFLSFSMATGTTGTNAGTCTTADRYVSIFLHNNHTGTITPGPADITFKIRSVKIFADTAYESGGVSILKADTVVRDAKAQATMMLSADDSKIEADTFNLPEFSTGGLRTPREAINAVNAYEDKLAQVDVFKRLVYRQRPTQPELEIGAWSGADFEDASANSLGDVCNRVWVETSDPAGNPLLVERTAGQQSTAKLEAIGSPGLTNPSFAIDTSGWSLGSGGGTIARDAVTFDTSPASLSVANTRAILTGTMTGTFVSGVTYVLTFALRWGSDPGYIDWVRFGNVGTGDYGQLGPFTPPNNTWVGYQVAWTPGPTHTSGVTVQIFQQRSTTALVDYRVDSFTLYRSTPTIVDRQGFRRTKILPVRSALTYDAAVKIADTWLASHRTVPLRGGGRAAIGGVRKVLGGQSVHPSQLLLHTGMPIRLSHRTDPDTGGHGRTGILAAVNYNQTTQEAQFSLDDDRHSHESLLERLAVVMESTLGGT